MRDFQKKIIINSLILAGIFCLLAVFLRRWGFIVGLAMGTATAIGNFILLGLKVKAINRPQPNIVFILGNLFLRYLAMGLVLWLATRISTPAFFGAALGLFMVRGGIYIFAGRERMEEK